MNKTLLLGLLALGSACSTAEEGAPGQARYGQPLPGTRQGFPKEGAPEALVRGKTYYLYVQADILGPVER